MSKASTIHKNWTLFLDRDGVINEKIDNDYVKNWSEFKFIDGAIQAISILSDFFDTIIIVTNQRGVGRKIMTELDLLSIHKSMIDEIVSNSGRIDKIYYCKDILDSSLCRKPNTGMAIQAKLDFPHIDFNKSVMVGDSISDMNFGKKLGMTTFMIEKNYNHNNLLYDKKFKSLLDCSNFLNKSLKEIL